MIAVADGAWKRFCCEKGISEAFRDQNVVYLILATISAIITLILKKMSDKAL